MAGGTAARPDADIGGCPARTGEPDFAHWVNVLRWIATRPAIGQDITAALRQCHGDRRRDDLPAVWPLYDQRCHRDPARPCGASSA